MARQYSFTVPRTRQRRAFDLDHAAGGDYRGGNLSGLDLHGVNLRGACFEGANLTGANLRQANLEGANLRHARLVKADLTEANLKHTALWQTKFSHAKTHLTDFRGAKNLARLTGTAYNADIRLPQLRRAITDMNYSVWQKIWRLQRDSIWSLVAVALALGGRASHLLGAPWDRWATIASLTVLGLSLLGLLWAHYIRLYKVSCWRD